MRRPARSPRAVAPPRRSRDRCAGSAPPGHLDLREQFVRLERRREKAAEEVLGPARALSPRAPQVQDRVERDHAGGKLGRRIGVDDAAPDRPARPRLQMPDDAAPPRRAGARQRRCARRARARAGARARPAEGPSLVLSRPRDPATRFRSTTTAGRTRRMFIIGTRLCPPASTLASSPYRARRSSASSTVRGAKYSNGAGRTAGAYRVPAPRTARLNCEEKEDERRAPAILLWVLLLPLRQQTGAATPHGPRGACPGSWNRFTTRRREGAGGLPAGPWLLRADEGTSSDLVAPCEWWTGLRLSVSRGEAPRPFPALCRLTTLYRHTRAPHDPRRAPAWDGRTSAAPRPTAPCAPGSS